MTKNCFIKLLQNRLELKSKKEAKVILEEVFKILEETFVEREPITIAGFGRFEVITQKGRKYRNPRTGEEVFVNEKRVPRFKARKELVERISSFPK